MRKLFLVSFFLYCISMISHVYAVNIGICLDDLSVSRWETDKFILEKKIKGLGGNPIVRVCNGNANLQVQQIYELVDKMSVTALIIVANNQSVIAPAVDYASSKGVKVIAYDRMISNCNLDYYVSFDNEKVGEFMADGVLQLKPTGNYVLISGPKKDNNSLVFRKGSMKKLESSIASGKIDVLMDIHVKEWSKSEAHEKIKYFYSLHKGIDLDVIIVANDNMAEGVIQALDELGKKNVLVTGQDAELSALQRIMAGKQLLTVYKPITTQAQLAGELAMKASLGSVYVSDQARVMEMSNGKKKVKSYLLTPTLVTRNNVKDIISKITFREDR